MNVSCVNYRPMLTLQLNSFLVGGVQCTLGLPQFPTTALRPSSAWLAIAPCLLSLVRHSAKLVLNFEGSCPSP